MVLGFVWSNVAWVALAVFLVAVGLALGYAMLRLAGTFARLSSLVAGIEREAMPVVRSINSTVELVNGHLDNLGQVTSSAASAAGAVDTAVRAVSLAVTKPVQKATGLAAGIAEGFASFRDDRDLAKAVDVAGQAARRRERELADELREAARPSPSRPAGGA